MGEKEIELEQENIIVYSGSGAVNSVNGYTGDVVLTTSDIENTSDYQTGTEVESAITTAISGLDIPTKTSELNNDGSDGNSTYVEADELATVATSGSYDDLLNKPTIPTVNNATLTITQNGTSAGTFTANDDTDTTIALTDTTYNDFTGTDGTSAGAAGLVPAPATTDAGKFLKADGTWDTAGGGPTVVQTTGTSTTDVMSQNAVTLLIGDIESALYIINNGGSES